MDHPLGHVGGGGVRLQSTRSRERDRRLRGKQESCILGHKRTLCPILSTHET